MIVWWQHREMSTAKKQVVNKVKIVSKPSESMSAYYSRMHNAALAAASQTNIL